MASLSASVCVVQETGLLNKGSLLSCSSLTHKTCKHDAASLPGPAKSSQTEAGLTEISRHLTGAVGSGVPVWAEEGIWVGGGGPSCPPGVNPACQVPPSNYHPCPPPRLPLSILAFPSVLSSIIHECLACSVHSNQRPNPSGIHYMRTSRAASNSFLQFSPLYKGPGGILCSYVV